MLNQLIKKEALIVVLVVLLSGCTIKKDKIEGAYKDTNYDGSNGTLFWFNKDSTFLEEYYHNSILQMANRGKYIYRNDSLFLIDFEWRTESETNYSKWQKRISSTPIARPGYYKVRNVAEKSFELMLQGFDDHVWVTYVRFNNSQTP